MQPDIDTFDNAHDYKVTIYFKNNSSISPRINWKACKYGDYGEAPAMYKAQYGAEYYCSYVFTPKNRLNM